MQDGESNQQEEQTMDWAAFVADVWNAVANGDVAESYITADGEVRVMAGELWNGALWGAETDEYGQVEVYRFDTEDEQTDWYEAAVTVLG